MFGTLYLTTGILSYLFRGQSIISQPTSLEIPLYNILPNTSGNGGVEPTAGSYSPVVYGIGDTYWEYLDGILLNVSPIVYNAPNDLSWGTIRGFGVRDQSANLLAVGIFDPHKVVLIGDPAPSFDAGSIRISLT